jgi:hypothetical protein
MFAWPVINQACHASNLETGYSAQSFSRVGTGSCINSFEDGLKK